jgi:hypothetical protein
LRQTKERLLPRQPAAGPWGDAEFAPAFRHSGPGKIGADKAPFWCAKMIAALFLC